MHVKSRLPGRIIEDTIMKLASDQYGLVTLAQLLQSGITLHTVKSRLRSGRLKRIHCGVYLVGPITVPLVWEMAAVLACGPTAVLSHSSASSLWRIPTSAHDVMKIRSDRSRPSKADIARRDPVDVIVRAGHRRRKAGVRIHMSGSVHDDEITVHDGIPVTTPTRTLFDLACCTSGADFERAAAEAIALNLTTTASISALAARHAGCPGARVLRNLVADGMDPAFTRSEAERLLLVLVRTAGLGHPRVNTRVAGYEVDFVWNDERLIVEVDGRSFHVSERSFERDRRRDADLVAQGYRVIRVTWRQIVSEPERLLVRLAQALVR